MNIIIMSGKTVNPIPVNATFLQKPFTAEQLLEVVRKAWGLAPKIASIPHAFSHTANNSLRTAAAEFPTLSTTF